ncbi:hypothetical protein L6452_24558 [Arctium lappa]|uniref:Uncharacterized protein n=1 Tax=Arctium lappa TaxID=4217 RepID=A0ACB9A9Z8_ARCLA|nr:hypothetical protein L6452_24558 [Arctium lappa]
MVFYCRCFSILSLLQVDTSVRAANTSAENFQTANSTFELRGRGSTSNPHNGSHTSQECTRRSVIPNTLRAFTLSELKEATKNFDESCMIGEGGFGKVHKGTVKSLEYPFKDIDVAVKRGKRGQKGYRQWETEVNVLGDVKLRHPNLVKLIGYCNEDHENESNWLLVYEYMHNKSVDDHLSDKSAPPLSWDRRLKIAKDAATGLAYLHEGMDKQIVFRDFKPPNILLDSEWNAKLSDFGFARDGPQDGRTHVSTAVVGTKGYAAPEYVQTGRMTSKIDVWSYGIFLEELITGQRPVTQNNSEKNPRFLKWACCYAGDGKSKLNADPRLENNYSEKSMEKLTFIAKKCLAKEPKSRPKMSEVLKMVEEAIALEAQQLPNAGKT